MANHLQAGPNMAGEADAELLRFCAEFDALERQSQAALNGVTTLEAEEHADLLTEAIRERQEALLDRICSMPCTTAEGRAALAASFVLWDNEIYIESDDPNADANERLIAALIRSVLGTPGG